tara:strand:+ start:199 stop:2166 length:1968 start_codon:yes stop_codon:yes gene_type:complete
MAHSGVGSYALGGGQGAISGAAAGASVGGLFGPPGAAVGGVAGGVAGLGLGLLGTALDSKAQHEQEEALRQAEAEFEAAQKQYDRQVLQSGAAAREAVQQGMAAKGAADANAVSGAMSDAEQQADKAGLIGAEKADYVAGVRQRIERERTASSPAVYQQALGGARQEAQAGTQRAAIALQTAAGKYDSNVTQISGQNTTSASAAIGQSLGAVMQTAGALHGADISFAKDAASAAAKAGGLATDVGAKAASTSPTGGITDADVASYGSITDPLTAPFNKTAPGGTVTQPGSQIGTGYSNAPSSRAGATQPLLGGTAGSVDQGPFLGPAEAPASPAAIPAPSDEPSIPGYGSLVNPTGMGGSPYQSMDLMSPDELMGSRSSPDAFQQSPVDVSEGTQFSDPGPGYDRYGDPLYSDQPAAPAAALAPPQYAYLSPEPSAQRTVAPTPGPAPQDDVVYGSIPPAATAPAPAPVPAPVEKRYGELEQPGRRLPTRTDRNERLPYHSIEPRVGIDTMAPAPAPVAAPVAAPAPAPAPVAAPVAGGVNSKVLQPGYQWVWSDELMGYTQQPINYGLGAGGGPIAGFASGGIAGAAGPEVAMLGEQGPELVLNAKQTQQLAQALPAAAPRPQAAPTQAGGQGVFSQSPEELEAYLEELLTRAS